jgi:hypothetical protein
MEAKGFLLATLPFGYSRSILHPVYYQVLRLEEFQGSIGYLGKPALAGPGCLVRQAQERGEIEKRYCRSVYPARLSD